MPVFDFVCVKCQKKFSELVWGAEKINCPRCGADFPRRLFSGFHTISDATRLETHAADLPTMAQWEKARRAGVSPMPSVRKQKREKTKRLTMRGLKPRAAISQARHSH